MVDIDFIKKTHWVYSQHRDRNQLYDGHDYSLHLDMVSIIAEAMWPYTLEDLQFNKVLLAACAHDLIEDCGLTYNDVKSELGEFVAEIVRACTNYTRGRNRKERMPDFIYEDIRNTPGATFIKMCDRMANLLYSKDNNSSMYDKYKKEMPDFLEKVGADKYPYFRDKLKEHSV